MGAYLSAPVKEKECDEGANETYEYGACAMQGWRTDMEDAHMVVLNVHDDDKEQPPTGLFGVFDGHGGKEVALFAAAHLPAILLGTEGYRSGDLGASLEQAFLRMDEVLVQPEHRAELAAYKNEGGEGGGRGGGRAGGMTINSSQLPEALLDALGMPGERGFVLKLVKAPNGRVQIDDIMDEEEEDPEEAAAAGGDDGGAAAGVEAAGSGAAAVAAAADGSSPFAAAAAAGEAPGGAGATQKRKRAVQAGGGSLGEAGADAEDGGEAADGVGAGAAAAAGVREVVVEELSSPRGEGGEGGEYGGPAAGCTAVCAVVRGDALVVANAGDSRCVLSRAGRAVAMTQDHKPNDPEEFARITAAGGFVADGRVNGSLNLSRALGDLEYKQARQLPPQAQAVTAFPEVRAERLQGGDEFLILACDGIWDVLTNQEAVDFVRARLAAGRTPAQVCADACDRCLAPDTAGCGKGCDNMSFVLVMLKAWAGGAAAAAP